MRRKLTFCRLEIVMCEQHATSYLAFCYPEKIARTIVGKNVLLWLKKLSHDDVTTLWSRLLKQHSVGPLLQKYHRYRNLSALLWR